MNSEESFFLSNSEELSESVKETALKYMLTENQSFSRNTRHHAFSAQKQTTSSTSNARAYAQAVLCSLKNNCTFWFGLAASYIYKTALLSICVYFSDWIKDLQKPVFMSFCIFFYIFKIFLKKRLTLHLHCAIIIEDLRKTTEN